MTLADHEHFVYGVFNMANFIELENTKKEYVMVKSGLFLLVLKDVLLIVALSVKGNVRCNKIQIQSEILHQIITGV